MACRTRLLEVGKLRVPYPTTTTTGTGTPKIILTIFRFTAKNLLLTMNLGKNR